MSQIRNSSLARFQFLLSVYQQIQVTQINSSSSVHSKTSLRNQQQQFDPKETARLCQSAWVHGSGKKWPEYRSFLVHFFLWSQKRRQGKTLPKCYQWRGASAKATGDQKRVTRWPVPHSLIHCRLGYIYTFSKHCMFSQAFTLAKQHVPLSRQLLEKHHVSVLIKTSSHVSASVKPSLYMSVSSKHALTRESSEKYRMTPLSLQRNQKFPFQPSVKNFCHLRDHFLNNLIQTLPKTFWIRISRAGLSYPYMCKLEYSCVHVCESLIRNCSPYQMYSVIWSLVMGIMLEFLGGRVLLEEEFHCVGNLRFYILPNSFSLCFCFLSWMKGDQSVSCSYHHVFCAYWHVFPSRVDPTWLELQVKINNFVLWVTFLPGYFIIATENYFNRLF